MEHLTQLNRHHDPENGVFGDCHRTAIAMVLGVPQLSVPNFGIHYGNSEAWDKAERAYFDSMGLFAINLPMTADTPEDCIRMIHKFNPGVPLIISGMSPGGTNHSCAVRGDGKILDPQHRDEPLTGPTTDGFFWITFFQPKNFRKYDAATAGGQHD